MSKIVLLFIFTFASISCAFGSLSKGIQLISLGHKQEGVELLENHFEKSSTEDQAKVALILSRIQDVKMENKSIYYVKYALNFLKKNLTDDEISILNLELADYYLGLGDLNSSKKYYKLVFHAQKNKELLHYSAYRLAWVYFNLDDIKNSHKYLIYSIKSNNLVMKKDALYLLGRVSIRFKYDLMDYLGKGILDNKSFLKGIKESEDSISDRFAVGSYSKLFLSVHNKIKSSCEILSRDLTGMPVDLEISKNDLESFLKACLVEKSSLAGKIKTTILNKTFKYDMDKVLALSYYIDGEKDKACDLYKKAFTRDEDMYKGLMLTCSTSSLDIAKISKIPTSCSAVNYFSSINHAVLNKLTKVKDIQNQSLLYNALLTNSDSKHFLSLKNKLINCNLEKNLTATYHLSKTSLLKVVDMNQIGSTKCEDNSQNMLIAMYIKYIVYSGPVNKMTMDCFKDKMSFKSKKYILETVNFSLFEKSDCSFRFDCSLKEISGYVHNSERLSTSKVQSELKPFFIHLNRLQSLSKKVSKGVSLRQIESFLNKVIRVKRIFKKPVFFNDSLMKKASIDYNLIITKILASIESFSSLEPAQKDLLNNAFESERVVL